MFFLKNDYLVVWVTPSGQVESTRQTWTPWKRNRFTKDLETLGCAWVLTHRTPYSGPQRCTNIKNEKGREILFLILDGYANPCSSAWKKFSADKQKELVTALRREACKQRHPAFRLQLAS